MRTAMAILLGLLCLTPLMAQNADTKLKSELQALHTKWFTAFDGGDGATMDQMEMEELILVMPTGFVWTKTAPRAGEQQKHKAQSERTLSDVSVRRFKDTAILTGILASKSEEDNSREATTVVVCAEFW